MKLKLESISTVHQNVFLIKLIAAILITGLAFRFYVFRFGQIPPVQVSVNDNSDPQISPPSVIISDNEDLIPIDIEVEKCDLFTGKWIKDTLGPIYTNGSCGIAVDGHQNCITNGRPDSGFLYWKWKPNDCSLPRFDPQRFLQFMRNKSWAFIGDSISRNHVESLLCMLSTVEKPVEVYHDENYRSKRWLFPSHNLTVSNIWSPFLVQAAIFEDSNGVSSAAVQLQLDRLDKTWTDLFPSIDYAIISSGEWFLKTAVYHENANLVGCHGCPESSNLTDLGFDYAYNTSLRHVMDFIARSDTKGMIFFRTSVPDHFENGEWHNGGTCKKTEPVSDDEVEMKVVNKILRDVEISQYERVVTEMSQETGNFKLLDFSGMLLTRPDGHPGAYREFRPFDKDKNAKMAKKNKEIYLQEMEGYKRTKEEEAMSQKKEEEELMKLHKQEALQLLKKKEKTDNIIKKKKETTKNKKKNENVDPNKPKKPASSFFLFCKDARKSLAEEHPGINNSTLTAHISLKWKELGEEERQIYNGKAAELMEAYKKEVEEYNKTKTA